MLDIKMRSDDRLFAFMVERACFRDRLYFCSDTTAATALGVSRRTIIRARKRLEDAGRIVRIGKKRIGPCKATVIYSFPPKVIRFPLPQPSTNHAEYIKSDHWRSFRKWYKESRPWECSVCRKTQHLSLHHLTYERVGRESLEDVVPLCRLHHLRAHRRIQAGVPPARAHL